MENQEIQTENIKMDEIGIGEDVPQVTPQRVTIISYEIRAVTKNEKHIGDKLVLKCKHPEMDDNIEISSVKYEASDKIRTTGIWIKLDKNGKIPYKSALANLLRFVTKAYIKDLVSIEINTALDDNGYLALKAY